MENADTVLDQLYLTIFISEDWLYMQTMHQFPLDDHIYAVVIADVVKHTCIHNSPEGSSALQMLIIA